MLHVTEVLKLAGLVDDRFFTEEARDRGTALHLATVYFDEGNLDDESLDPAIRGGLDAYRAFYRDVHPVILACEEPVEDLARGYCGTPDRVLVINGREGVLDIKRGAESPWHAIQLAAYAHTYGRPMARWNLYLGQDGKYKLIERRSRLDWPVFEAALLLVQWRNQCKAS